MNIFKLTVFLFLTVSISAYAIRKDCCINTISGEESVMSLRYVTPIISNGSLSLHVDEQGSQNRIASSDRLQGILWEGRRKGLPGDYLFPFGFLRQEIISEKTRYEVPLKWSQSLNSRDGLLTCEDNYACGLDIRTEMFVHAQKDIIVVRKHFTAHKSPVTFRLKYDLPCDEKSFKAPRRMSFEPSWNESSRSIDIRYRAYGLRDYEGIISFCSYSSADYSVATGNLSLSVFRLLPGAAGRSLSSLCFPTISTPPSIRTGWMASRKKRQRKVIRVCSHPTKVYGMADGLSKSTKVLEQVETKAGGGRVSVGDNLSPTETCIPKGR